VSKRTRKTATTEESTTETEAEVEVTEEILASSPILADVSSSLSIAETAHNEVLKSALIDKLKQAPPLEVVMKNPWHYVEWLATVQQLVS